MGRPGVPILFVTMLPLIGENGRSDVALPVITRKMSRDRYHAAAWTKVGLHVIYHQDPHILRIQDPKS